MTDHVRLGHGSSGMLRLSWLLLLAACSSESVNQSDASTADAKNDTQVGFPDSGTDADAADAACVPETCPSSPPSAGSSCTGNATCEYGGAARSECDTFALCISGQWQIQPAPDGGWCATNPSCPASYGDTPDGGTSCGSTQYVCYYQEGTCGCVNGNWACTLPVGSGCPNERPRIGAACSNAATCNYCQDCSALAGDMLECKCGQWQVQPPPLCPP